MTDVPGGAIDARPPASRFSAAAVLRPALTVGAACGGAGFVVGGAAGIIKGTAPFLFATASAVQTFALGTTFWGVRSAVLQAWTPSSQTPLDLTKASSISGGLTGGLVAATLRGRANVLPGVIMFSLFGCLGQMGCNTMSARRDRQTDAGPGFWRRMSERSFSPVTVLTNEEYAQMLRKKQLKLDVEISIIDDKIAALKAMEAQQTKTNEEPTTAKD